MNDRAIDYEDYVQNFILLINPTQGQTCSICLQLATEDNQRTITPHCRHAGVLYHEDCLLRWLRPDEASTQHDNNSCPICRKRLWRSTEQPDRGNPETVEDMISRLVSFGLVCFNDPMRDSPRLDDRQLWRRTFGKTIENIATNANRGLAQLFGRVLDKDLVRNFTSIDLDDTSDRTRVAKASRMMHFYAMLEAPTHLPELVHLIRRGIITSSFMEFWLGKIDPEE